MPLIEVHISPLGLTTVITSGFTGVACQDATRSLEAALGFIQADERTAEYYATAVTPAETHSHSPLNQEFSSR